MNPTLDYNPTNGTFFLRVPRDCPLTPSIVQTEHGLDMSLTASTPREAVLFTREPYAAVAFYEYATERCKAQLLELQGRIDDSWRQDSRAHIACPPDEELWPFQKAGVEYAMNHQHTLIADEPGLGKTSQAICLANEMQAERILVICPASIRLQWAKNIRRWSTMDFGFIVYPILHGRHGVHPTAQWTIVSYDLARTETIGRALARGEYDLLVLDEAHYLKENTALRTRAVFGGGDDPKFEALATRSQRILALTGTPLPNRPREAYTMARGMCFDAIDWMSEDKFKERFNPSRRVDFTDSTGEERTRIDERTGRHHELQARLRGNFMVRRNKRGPRGVMTQLKMPEYDLIYMEETAAVKSALKAERMLDIDPDQLEGVDMATLGSIATVRRVMGEAMAPQVAEYVDLLFEGGEEKLLLFGHHHSVLDYWQRHLEKWGITRIDGRLNGAQKQARVDDWIKDPTKRLMIGNTISMGTGTDGLQEVCNHCVFGEPDWVNGVNQQGVDRLDRGGQGGAVQADFCVVAGGFAEKVLGGALRKGQTTHKALDDTIFLEDA